MVVRRFDEETDNFYRQMTWPQEIWSARNIGRTWPGGYRWFRSENVTPIEYYKRVNNSDGTDGGPRPILNGA